MPESFASVSLSGTTQYLRDLREHTRPSGQFHARLLATIFDRIDVELAQVMHQQEAPSRVETDSDCALPDDSSTMRHVYTWFVRVFLHLLNAYLNSRAKHRPMCFRATDGVHVWPENADAVM